VPDRGHAPYQTAEIVLVPGSQILSQPRAAFPGECHSPDPPGPDPVDPLSQALGNFPVRVAEEAVVGKEIGMRLSRKRRRFGGEKGGADCFGDRGIRRQGDKCELHADRTDIDTDIQ